MSEKRRLIPHILKIFGVNRNRPRLEPMAYNVKILRVVCSTQGKLWSAALPRGSESWRRFAYSDLAGLKIGRSESALFRRVRKAS